MSTLVTFISIAFFIWILRSILFWVTIWQKSNYHLREFFTFEKRYHLRSKISVYFSYLKLLLIAGYGIVVFHDNLLLSYQILVTSVILLQLLFIFREIISGTFTFPKLTLKTITISLLTFIIIYGLFSLYLVEQFFFFLLLDRMVPILVMMFVFLFSFPSEIYEDVELEQAAKRIQKNPDLIRVLIVGEGFGIREYLTQMLETKFSILSLSSKENSLLDIARIILKKIDISLKICLIETKTDPKDTLTALIEILNPQIVVFADCRTEKEYDEFKVLLRTLPRNSEILFNGTNTRLFKLYIKTRRFLGKQRNIIYTFTEDKTKAMYALPAKVPGLFAYRFLNKKRKTYVKMVKNTKSTQLILPSSDREEVEKILPVIFIADYLGISREEIEKNITSLLS